MTTPGRSTVGRPRGGPSARGPHDRRVRRLRPLVAALAVTGIAAALLAVLGLHAGSASAAPRDTALPLLASTAGEPSGAQVDGIGADVSEGVLLHIHAHLQIYVGGRQRAVPGGIGIVPPYAVASTPAGPFIAAGTAFYWLHTHDETGVIHIESPVRRMFTLGEFFDVWGQPLDAHRVGPARGTVTAVVNGRRFGGDPRAIPLHAHDVVQLMVGPVVPFQPYAFPPGL